MVDFTSFISVPETASFLDFQRHFLERPLNLESYREVVIGVSVVVGFILLIMLFIHFRPRKPYVPLDWVVNPEQIREVLTQAMGQRSKMELHFALGGERRPALRCTILKIEKDVLLLEASDIATLSQQWEGRRADCFFMLRTKDNYLFYAFSAAVADIKAKNDYCLIVVPLPERLESRQKRSYLRIAPPEEYMLGAAGWYDQNMPKDADRNDLSLWQRPSRLCLPGTREDFSIRDISSGGIRLHLPRHILMEDMEFFHISTQFIIMLDLWEPTKAARLRFWLLCRMQSPALDLETKGMDLGAQFLAWAKAAENGSSALTWFKLASSGEVEPLGNWIMRRHLEFFRESEQALTFGQRQTA